MYPIYEDDYLRFKNVLHPLNKHDGALNIHHDVIIPTHQKHPKTHKIQSWASYSNEIWNIRKTDGLFKAADVHYRGFSSLPLPLMAQQRVS